MRLIIRLFKMAKPWARYLVVATLALFVVTAINLATPFVTRQIIALMESGAYRQEIRRIVGMALVLLGLFALRAVCQFLSSYLSHLSSWRLVSRLRSVIYSHFQKLSMSYYQDKQTGQLMSRVINDTSTFENLIAHAIPDLATNILTLAGVLVILLTINPLLALLVCAPIPFIALLSVVLRRIRRSFSLGQKKIAELNALLAGQFFGHERDPGL